MRGGMIYPVECLLTNLQVCLGKLTPTTSWYGVLPLSIEEYLIPRAVRDALREVMDAPSSFVLNEEDYNIHAARQAVEAAVAGDQVRARNHVILASLGNRSGWAA